MSNHIESVDNIPTQRATIYNKIRYGAPTQCPTCGKTFIVVPDRVKNGSKPFCSQPCKRYAKPVEERFWLKVNKNGPIPHHRPELGPCWNWMAGVNKNGYGVFNVASGGGIFPVKTKTILAHRVAWNIANGFPIDDKSTTGGETLHECDNPACCNPSHLRRSSHKENMKDAGIRGQMERGTDRAHAKLNPDKVIKMRQSHAEGITSYAELGRMFNISRASARQVILRTAWKDVP